MIYGGSFLFFPSSHPTLIVICSRGWILDRGPFFLVNFGLLNKRRSKLCILQETQTFLFQAMMSYDTMTIHQKMNKKDLPETLCQKMETAERFHIAGSSQIILQRIPGKRVKQRASFPFFPSSSLSSLHRHHPARLKAERQNRRRTRG